MFKSNKVARFQLEIPESRLKELEVLMAEAGISTKKELVNNALTLLEWAIGEKKAGYSIASVDNEKEKYRELVMPILERIK